MRKIQYLQGKQQFATIAAEKAHDEEELHEEAYEAHDHKAQRSPQADFIELCSCPIPNPSVASYTLREQAQLSLSESRAEGYAPFRSGFVHRFTRRALFFANSLTGLTMVSIAAHQAASLPEGLACQLPELKYFAWLDREEMYLSF